MINNVKKEILQLLQSDDWNQILEELLCLPRHKVLNILFSALYSIDEKVKNTAVKAMGIVVSDMALKDMEAARNIMRRLMWTLNDESGGIGWGTPEAMGEIIAMSKEIAKEYLPILISYLPGNENFLEHEKLQQGLIRSIGRVAPVYHEILKEVIPYLRLYLNSKEQDIQTLTIWVLSVLDKKNS